MALASTRATLAIPATQVAPVRQGLVVTRVIRGTPVAQVVEAVAAVAAVGCLLLVRLAIRPQAVVLVALVAIIHLGEVVPAIPATQVAPVLLERVVIPAMMVLLERLAIPATKPIPVTQVARPAQQTTTTLSQRPARIQ